MTPRQIMTDRISKIKGIRISAVRNIVDQIMIDLEENDYAIIDRLATENNQSEPHA